MTEQQAHIDPRNIAKRPSDILRGALSHIQSDGVPIYDETEQTWHTWHAHVPVQVDQLPQDLYVASLIKTSRVVAGSVQRIVSAPDLWTAERELRRLGLFLTAYQHAPNYLERATDLIKMDERGDLVLSVPSR